MSISVLIVTPQGNYGTSLRQGFDPARFSGFSTSDFTESINYVRKNNTTLVVLDTELEDIELSVMDIGFALRQMKPEIRFIIIGAAGQDVDTSSLSPVATLMKPVTAVDLQNALENLTIPSSTLRPMNAPAARETGSAEPHSKDDASRLVWLKDVSKAAQHLTRLTLESSAQAALITQQNELWAYAGQLSREAAQELTHSIQRYWDTEGDSEMMRFVRLQATEAQHMLYARKIMGNLILALVFDAETPFSTIRSQAGKLVKNLAESSIIEMEQPLPPAPTVEQLTPALSVNVRSDNADQGYEDEELPPISELLGDVPPPIPPKSSVRSEPSWNQQVVSTPVQSVDVQEVSAVAQHSYARKEEELSEQFSFESSPAIHRESTSHHQPVMEEKPASKAPASEETTYELDSGEFELDTDMQMTRKQTVRADYESVAETRPQISPDPMSLEAHRILLEPASPILANLNYACLLIPRFNTHHLVGDFAASLNDWIPQICVAFGWRLEHISVRPDYLQWVARVPPSTSPGYLMRIIRQHTSDRIFSEFPRFKKENPSGDFWAPGYLIMGSPQLHPPKLVRDYIKMTRSRQGY